MTYSNRDKVIALSICHIFETNKPLGKADEVAVLPDGAGISYGIPQGTDKSGNLDDILIRYLAKTQENGDEVLYAPYFKTLLPKLKLKAQRSVNSRAKDSELKRILKEAGKTTEMREAQEENINSRLSKALRACIGSNFTQTLSLAVVYDSLNHGSWERLRDRIKLRRKDYQSDEAFERVWITEYVKVRDNWLETHSKPILRKTDYRTDFFLYQIKRDNWRLSTPFDVHGTNLTSELVNRLVREMEDAPKVELIVADKAIERSQDVSEWKGQEEVRPENSKELEEAPMNEQPQEPTKSVVDGATSETSETKTGQVIEAATTNEVTGETTKVKTETEFQADTTKEVLERERPSFTTKIYAGIAFLGGIGTAAYNLLQNAFNTVNAVPTVNLVVFGLLALGFFYIGYLIWDKASLRAQERNDQKARYAADTKSNTVEFTTNGTSTTNTIRNFFGRNKAKEQVQGNNRTANS